MGSVGNKSLAKEGLGLKGYADGYGRSQQVAMHYETLNVPASSTPAEIRASYRTALLALHPDKTAAYSSAQNVTEGSFSITSGIDNSQYLRVQEAWAVLRDAECRAAYDASLNAHVSNKHGNKGESCLVIGEEIPLEEMEEGLDSAGGSEFWYPCRCSDFFMVHKRELEDAGLKSEEDNVDDESGWNKVNIVGEGGFQTSNNGREGGNEEGTKWDKQRKSIVLPCGSCSLHLRVHFWASCP